MILSDSHNYQACEPVVSLSETKKRPCEEFTCCLSSNEIRPYATIQRNTGLVISDSFTYYRQSESGGVLIQDLIMHKSAISQRNICHGFNYAQVIIIFNYNCPSYTSIYIVSTGIKSLKVIIVLELSFHLHLVV